MKPTSQLITMSGGATTHSPLPNLLYALPMDLVYIIVDFLDTEDIGILTRTSVQLCKSFQAVLYRRGEDKLPNSGGRLLDWAAQHGRLGTIKKFLKFARPKAPLHALVHAALEKAAAAGHEEIVLFLLHVEVNSTLHLVDYPRRNSSVLLYAIAARHTRIVRILLETKVNVHTPKKLADAADMLAGTVDDTQKPTDLAITKLLIKQGFNVRVTDERGSTLLHYITDRGYVTLVALLIELNLEVNYQDAAGITPLYCATNKGNLNIMGLLLRAGANPDICDHNGVAPMHLAASHITPDCAKILLAHGANVNVKSATGSTPLHVATGHPHTALSLVKVLVNAGALIPCQDIYGQVPLLLAVWGGNSPVVMFLIQRGALECPSLWSPELFWWACQRGYEEVVKRLLDTGLNIDSLRDLNGRTPLMAAICSRNTRVFLLLLSRIRNVDERDHEGQTALFIAANIGNAQIVHFLLSRASWIDYSDRHGVTPLMAAIRSRNTEAFYRLLLRCKEYDQIDETGRTALHHAVDVYNIPAVAKLLQKSRALNLPDRFGCTPLLIAARHGWVSIVALLLQKSDINVNVKDSEGYSPLTWAVTNRASTMVSHLLEHGAKVEEDSDILHPRYPPLLIQTSASGHMDIVCRLLQYGARTEVQDSSRLTPLIHAACSGYTGIIDMLLKKKANFQACDNNLRNVLFYAALYGQGKVVNMLLERGAGIEITDIEGRTPLAGAARNGHAQVVQQLLEKGACPEPEDCHGRTPLLLAAVKGYSKTIATLIPYGVNVNKVDSNQRTALSLAAEGGCTALIRLLLRQPEIEVDHPDLTGRTPLAWAVRAGNAHVVQLLVEGGADVAKSDKRGRTPLSWALEYGHKNVIKYLVKIYPSRPALG